MFEWSKPAEPQGFELPAQVMQAASVNIRVVPDQVKIKLQYRPEKSPDVAAMEAMVKTVFPASNQPSADKAPTIFCTAPNEWLLVFDTQTSTAIEAAIHSSELALADALTDISDSLIAIELNGKQTAALLAEGCGSDLQADSFAAGHSITSSLFHCPVIIHCIEKHDCWHLYVDRSVVGYLCDWFDQDLE